jgi:hypothetical protein
LVRVICIYIPLFLSLSTKFNSVWVSGREGTEGSDEIPGKGNVEPKKKKKNVKRKKERKKSRKKEKRKKGEVGQSRIWLHQVINLLFLVAGARRSKLWTTNHG